MIIIQYCNQSSVCHGRKGEKYTMLDLVTRTSKHKLVSNSANNSELSRAHEPHRCKDGDHLEQFRFIANCLISQWGLEELSHGAQNHSPCLDEQANIKKEKNFFEICVTEYHTGGMLKWN